VNIVWLGCTLMVIGSSWRSSSLTNASGSGSRRGRTTVSRSSSPAPQPQPACLREEIRETTDRREGDGAMTPGRESPQEPLEMSNVILFNLTTFLFGVASALYSAPLCKEREDRGGRHLACILAAVVSTAALGVRCTSRTRWDRPHPVTNLYESSSSSPGR